MALKKTLFIINNFGIFQHREPKLELKTGPFLGHFNETNPLNEEISEKTGKKSQSSKNPIWLKNGSKMYFSRHFFSKNCIGRKTNPMGRNKIPAAGDVDQKFSKK